MKNEIRQRIKSADGSFIFYPLEPFIRWQEFSEELLMLLAMPRNDEKRLHARACATLTLRHILGGKIVRKGRKEHELHGQLSLVEDREEEWFFSEH